MWDGGWTCQTCASMGNDPAEHLCGNCGAPARPPPGLAPFLLKKPVLKVGITQDIGLEFDGGHRNLTDEQIAAALLNETTEEQRQHAAQAWFSFNKATRFPAILLECPSLRRVSFSMNAVERLPGAISRLTALQDLVRAQLCCRCPRSCKRNSFSATTG